MLRYFTRLKMSLMPYIYANAVETARTGIPFMRGMALEFEEDENCAYLERQYMFGERMLVAPIFNEEGIGKFYLPEGIWTDYLTGEVFTGEKWYRKHYDYMRLPLLVREDSVIPKGAREDCPDYAYEEQVEFRVYELKERADCRIYNRSVVTADFEAVRREENIAITVRAEKPFTVRMVNQAIREWRASGADVTVDGKDVVLTPQRRKDGFDRDVTIELEPVHLFMA